MAPGDFIKTCFVIACVMTFVDWIVAKIRRD